MWEFLLRNKKKHIALRIYLIYVISNTSFLNEEKKLCEVGNSRIADIRINEESKIVHMKRRKYYKMKKLAKLLIAERLFVLDKSGGQTFKFHWTDTRDVIFFTKVCIIA